MPKLTSADTFETFETRAAQQAEISKAAGIRERREIAKMRKLDLRGSIPGDRTRNKPPTRADAKQSMRIDRELPTTTYLLDEPGRYKFRDSKTSLQVVERARYRLAANATRLDVETRKVKLVRTNRKEGK